MTKQNQKNFMKKTRKGYKNKPEIVTKIFLKKKKRSKWNAD